MASVVRYCPYWWTKLIYQRHFHYKEFLLILLGNAINRLVDFASILEISTTLF